MKARRHLPSKLIPSDWGKYFAENKGKSTEEIMEELQCAKTTVIRHQKEFGLNQAPGRVRGSHNKTKPYKITMFFSDYALDILDMYVKLIHRGNFNNTDRVPGVKDIDVDVVVNLAVYLLIKNHAQMLSNYNLGYVSGEIAEELLKKYNILAENQVRIISEQLNWFNEKTKEFNKEYLRNCVNTKKEETA